MSAKNGNGLDATNDQPAKTHTKQAADFTPPAGYIGAFPTRHNTIAAEVLSRLLKGENLTGMDAVHCCSTTRLAGTIEYLGKKYNWPIDRMSIDVGTSDGRVSVICVYYLSRATIRQAFDAGALAFCQSVKKARAKTRGQAPKAKAEAAKRNAARAAAKHDLTQGLLFSGGADA